MDPEIFELAALGWRTAERGFWIGLAVETQRIDNGVCLDSVSALVL